MAENSKKKRKLRASKGEAVEPAPVLVPDADNVPELAAGLEPLGDELTQPEPCPAEEPASVTVDELVGPATQAVAPAAGADDVGAACVEEPVSAELKAIVEALVFASPEPLTPKALCKLLDSEPAEQVQRAIDGLKQDYQQVRGLHLVEIAGGLQIVTRPDLNEWVRRLFHERKNTRLSVPSLETLAVIAYRQPVTAAEIAEIRGVNTSGVLSTLVERKLIKTAGRKAVVGRPFLYSTTREFLLRFGLNDVSDLPKVEDLADVLGFELPGLLNEGLPTEQLLPLGDPDEALQASEVMESASEAEAEPWTPSEPTAGGSASDPDWPAADPVDETPDEHDRPAREEPTARGPQIGTTEAPDLDEPIVPEPDLEA